MITGVKRLDVDVEETELSVAFELNMEQLRQQQVFAFLPLRRYGLRFIVQVSSPDTLGFCDQRQHRLPCWHMSHALQQSCHHVMLQCA